MTLNRKRQKDGNIVFRYNYCDGGKSAEYIGFRGICTPENIAWHVSEKRDIWCNAKEGVKKRTQTSLCRQYYDASLYQKHELYQEMLNYYVNCENVCEECAVLYDWKAFSNGIIKSAKIGKLCVLTTILPHEDKNERTYEEERIIFGLFLIDEIHKFDEPENGYCDYVSSVKKEYRLSFTEEQAKKLKFWNYYYCENTSEAKWGSSQIRYLLDEEAAKILKDACAVKKNTADEKIALDMYDAFCRKHKIKKDT